MPSTSRSPCARTAGDGVVGAELQRADADGGAAGIGVGLCGKGQRAGPGFLEAARIAAAVADRAVDFQRCARFHVARDGAVDATGAVIAALNPPLTLMPPATASGSVPPIEKPLAWNSTSPNTTLLGKSFTTLVFGPARKSMVSPDNGVV